MNNVSEWLALEEELALKAARTNILAFMGYCTPHLRLAWHHRAWAKLIHEMIWGTSRRLIVSCPPRHGKTETFSRHLPAFLLGIDPNLPIIACSYGSDLAQRNNRDVQRIMSTDEYKRVFPATKLFGSNIRTVAQGSWLRNSEIFEVVGRRGVYKCAGVGGPITGAGGAWLIADDLLRNMEDAMSQTIKEKQFEWWQSTFRTRLAKDGRIVLIMTRWSDDDVPGRLIELAKADSRADQWKVVNFPAINEEGPTEYDPRQAGEPLWPDFFPRPELEKIRANSVRVFQSLYQGDPVPPGGSIIKEGWWRYYDPGDLPNRFDEIVISWDLSFTGDKGSDYTVGQAWGKKDGRAYLLRQFRAKVPFTRQIDAVVDLYNAYPNCRAVLVEKAANGAALIDTLQAYIPNLVPIRPEGSKEVRVQAITPIMEAGNVFIPDPRLTPWAAELVIECTRFPSGRHDDQVDSMSQGLRRLFPPMPFSGPFQFHSFTRRSPTAGL